MLKFKTMLSEAAFNVGITSSDNADLQKLITYLQGTNNSEEIVMVANSTDNAKVKIKRSFQDQAKEIRAFIKDNDLTINFPSSMFGEDP